jgi:hypothetical protein
VTLGLSDRWDVTSSPAVALSLPEASVESPAVQQVEFTARTKPYADQSPEVYRMALSVKAGDRTFGAGHDLVEVEKRRPWYVAAPPPEVAGEFEPEIPAQALDAKQTKLWDLNWELQERDTLVDFAAPVGQRVFAITNVSFAEPGEIGVRIRGDEKIDVWLGGARFLTEKPKDDERMEALESGSEKAMKVPGRKWLPLVLRYQRVSPHPNTDMVFLDKAGRVIWTAEFRVSPE